MKTRSKRGTTAASTANEATAGTETQGKPLAAKASGTARTLRKRPLAEQTDQNEKDGKRPVKKTKVVQEPQSTLVDEEEIAENTPGEKKARSPRKAAATKKRPAKDQHGAKKQVPVKSNVKKGKEKLDESATVGASKKADRGHKSATPEKQEASVAEETMSKASESVVAKNRLLPLKAASPVKPPPGSADIYDVGAYGEEEFGPEEEPTKGKRKRRPRVGVSRKKTMADIVLTFGQEPKEKVLPKLKEIKNLKTPQPPKQRVKPAATFQPILPPTSIVVTEPDISMATSFEPEPPMPEPSPQLLPALPPGVPSTSTSTPSNSTSKARTSQTPKDQSRPSANTLAPPAVTQRYRTPAVPKHISKERKVSTPRPEDQHNAKSTKEWVKVCFGFSDDESEEDELGISPVRGSESHPPSNWSQLSSVSSLVAPTYQPNRFEVSVGARSRVQVSRSGLKSPNHASRKKAEKALSDTASATFKSPSKRSNVGRSSEARSPSKLPYTANEDKENQSQGSSLYEDVFEESIQKQKPPQAPAQGTDTGRDPPFTELKPPAEKKAKTKKKRQALITEHVMREGNKKNVNQKKPTQSEFG
jgi:hypothetical protein